MIEVKIVVNPDGSHSYADEEGRLLKLWNPVPNVSAYHAVEAEEELTPPKCSKGCIPLNCKSPDNCEFDKLDK